MENSFQNIKKIGVISDTHIPVRAESLPKIVSKKFKDVDLILHAGDIVEKSVLDELNKIAKVIAVKGNMDPFDISEKLPFKILLNINNFKIGLIHGIGSREGIRERITVDFPDSPDCIVYGHTHKPYNKIENGILFFNPGSATDTIYSDKNSIGILHIGNTIKGEHIMI